MSAMRIPDYGQRHKDATPATPLEVYRGRAEVTPAQRAMLHLVDRLSRRHGFCYASMQYLADELKLCERQVQRLAGQLHAGGYLAITKRRSQTNMLRVRKWPPAVDNLAQAPRGEGDIDVTPGVTSMSPPGVTSVSPNALKNNLIGGQPDAPGQTRLPFNGERAYFNPHRPRHTQDHRPPLQRLAHGFREQRFLYTSHDGQVRTIAHIEWVNDQARLQLVDDAGPDRPPHVVWIKAEDLKAWTFWR